MQALQLLLTSGLLLGSLFGSALATATEQLDSPRVQLIVPQLLSVAEHKECLKETDQEFCAEIRMVLDFTGLLWLDQALLARLDLSNKQNKNQPVDREQHLQQLKQQATTWLTQSYADIKEAREADEPYYIGYDHQDSIRFIAQRNHLASFKQFSYGYSGGAHGMYHTSYLLFDLSAQRQLLLNDILQSFAHVKLLEALRELYKEHYAEYAESWLSEKASEQAETLLTDNFVFNEQGMTFSYPPYVLGPYSEGEVRLSLDYSQLQEILKPEYVLNM